ncbi:MAG: CDP-glycerol glycerophosphotransferase family protein [Lachnospiraceae bacterium]|nr:CDP-glycerol glycerophosphotransferase family protein [Lachnospiraceae bacterium]
MNIVFLSNCYFLYIDPGTGSMLFAVFMGIIGTLYFVLRGLFIKLKFIFTSGKVSKDNKKIPVVIFSEDKRYFSIFEPLLDEFENRKFKVVYMTCSEDDSVFNKNYQYIEPQYIGKGNIAFARLNILNAYVLLATTPGLDVYQWKRSKSVDYYIHILHAPNEVLLYKMLGLDFYDAIFLSGKYQLNDIRAIEKIRNLKEKEIEFIGIPYLDYKKEKLLNSKRINNGNQKTVLLAPTWGDNGILKRFGTSIIGKLIDTGYNIVIRPHPQSYISEKEMLDNLMSKYNGKNIEWNNDTDNFDILNRSDILISDYSGVIFDFTLVFDKPIIYTDVKFDNSVYDAWWVDYKLWSFRILEKLGHKLTEDNLNDLRNIIDECLCDEKYRIGREEARNETWQNMGDNGKIAVDFIINKYECFMKNN